MRNASLSTAGLGAFACTSPPHWLAQCLNDALRTRRKGLQFFSGDEIERHHRGQLQYSSRTPWIVERTGDLVVALLNELVCSQIPGVRGFFRVRRFRKAFQSVSGRSVVIGSKAPDAVLCGGPQRDSPDVASAARPIRSRYGLGVRLCYRRSRNCSTDNPASRAMPPIVKAFTGLWRGMVTIL